MVVRKFKVRDRSYLADIRSAFVGDNVHWLHAFLVLFENHLDTSRKTHPFYSEEMEPTNDWLLEERHLTLEIN